MRLPPSFRAAGILCLTVSCLSAQPPGASTVSLGATPPGRVGARDGKETDASKPLAGRRPNLVLIVADDLGYGDLGCYGQERLKTPELDRLAAEGRRYTQFYAGSTVCAPSRSVLMTGQHTGHTLIRGNGKLNLRPEDVTVAEVLREADYTNALYGKWGLGHEGSEGVPTQQGFDSFFGYLDQHHAHNYYPTFLVRDDARVELDNVVPKEGRYGQGVASEKRTYSHDLITDEALRFLDRDHAQPFFLFLAWTLPHANNEAGREGMEVPDLGAFADADWPAPERGFAAMVARLDRDVGRLRAKLEERGLTDDTLVIFTSDNGPHNEGGHRAKFFGSSGELSGTKRSLHEGGIRVPMIAAWPGVVPAGTVSDRVAGFWDVLPTFAELAGGKAREAQPAELDGVSFAASLAGDDSAESSDAYYEFYEGAGGRALRRGDWKLVEQPVGSAPRLYDLKADPSELRDLSAKQPRKLEELLRRMAEHHTPSSYWFFNVK